MKIRNGFVSNSSSSSFIIPSMFLTDEQKEAIFSCLCDGRDIKIEINKRLPGLYPEEHIYPERGLPHNEEYHKIFQDMVDNGEWDDWGWESGYFSNDGDKELVMGACDMWNGSLEKFFERIGIDTTALQISNHGHAGIHMPSHPEALKILAKWREKQIEDCVKLKEEYDKIPEEDTAKAVHEYHMLYEGREITDNPYLMGEKEFIPFGEGSLMYRSSDGYSYWRNIRNENP